MEAGIHPFDFARDGDWFMRHTPYVRCADACGFVVIGEDGKQKGAAVFDNFLFASAQVTLLIQSPYAIKIGLLEFAGRWIFSTMKKKRVYALVSETNVKSLRLTKRIGFSRVWRIPEGANRGVDMIVLELLSGGLNLKSRKVRWGGSWADG